jgi:hypothetical protein
MGTAFRVLTLVGVFRFGIGSLLAVLVDAAACGGHVDAAAARPCCLTIESEERETWTAESLRIAL